MEGLVLVEEHPDDHLQDQPDEHGFQHEDDRIGKGSQEKLVSEDVAVVVQPDELPLT